MRISITLTIIGPMLIMLAIMQLFPILVDSMYWEVYFVSALISTLLGGICLLLGEKKISNITRSEVAFIVALTWVAIIILSTLPFMLHPKTNMKFVDAFFESSSGVTTTGVSIISNLSRLPIDILTWRIITQFIGGLGVIFSVTCAIFKVKITDMKIFATESAEDNTVLSNHIKVSTTMILSYIGLIIACSICYFLSGMGSFFDSITHAIATVSTGGFGNYNESIGYFQSTAIEYTAIVFMILGSTPLMIYMYTFNRKIKKNTNNEEIRYYYWLIMISTLVIVAWIFIKKNPIYIANKNSVSIQEIENIFRNVLFSVSSIASTTGFINTGDTLWGSFPQMLIFFMVFIGGCSNSTAGGIKIFRIIIILKGLKNKILSIVRPDIVLVNKINGNSINKEIESIAYNFLFLFLLVFVIGSIILSTSNIDHITAMSLVAGALSNSGSAVGAYIGPNESYADLGFIYKYTLSFIMILGRLEIFNIIVLFFSYNWGVNDVFYKKSN